MKEASRCENQFLPASERRGLFKSQKFTKRIPGLNYKYMHETSFCERKRTKLRKLLHLIYEFLSQSR
jgi:hypothetical protein